MRLQRKEDWPELLAEFLESRRVQTFAWGENDCALFVCDAVLAMTGTDIAEAFRGRYSTSVGAMRAMVEAGTHRGLVGVAEAVTAEFEMQEVPVLMAQRGDVVLFDVSEEAGPALGVVGLHGHTAVSVGPDGAVNIPVAQCRRAWRVG